MPPPTHPAAKKDHQSQNAFGSQEVGRGEPRQTGFKDTLFSLKLNSTVPGALCRREEEKTNADPSTQ